MSLATDLYLRAARAAGCPADTVRRLAAYGICLTPRQLAASGAARLCDRPCTHRPTQLCGPECAPVEVGYGGARGGGKSHWGMAQLIDDCLRFPGLKCLLLRRVGKAAKENFEDLRRRMLMAIPHEYKRQDGILIFRNGSRIVLGHFKDAKDVDNYLGIEYDVILVEEATTLQYEKYRDIGTCCRSSKRGWRPRMYSTTNPGGIGHAWYKELLVDPWKNERLGKGAQTNARFVPATVSDNPFVDAGYRTKLNGLTGWLRRAWLDGDWDIAIGQFFTTFRPDVHVLESPIREIPKQWTVWAALDHGHTHFTMAYLFAKESGESRKVYALGEYGARRTLPERNADGIKAMLWRFGLEPYHLARFVAGSDVFNKERDGGCPADDYKAAGITLTCANMDRCAGAAEILTRFGDLELDPPIEPTLFLNPECSRLIQTLPMLQHDPHRPEDVLKVDCDEDGRGGDDAYDAFRYGVMWDANRKPARPATGPAPRSPVLPQPHRGVITPRNGGLPEPRLY